MGAPSGMNRIRRISVQQFGDFLNDKGVSQDCSECNHTGFAINVLEDDVGIVSLPLGRISETDMLELESVKPLVLPGLSVTCGNCGYTKVFSIAAVMRWVAEQQRAGGNDD